MNILWHMPTFRQHTCGISRRAMHFGRELIQAGHHVEFTVRTHRTDVTAESLAMFDKGLKLSLIDVRTSRPVHWSLQSRARYAIARRVVRELRQTHDLFISCQPEAVVAYKERWPNRAALLVCGGTTILHDAADAARHGPSQGLSRISFCIDRVLKRRNERRAFMLADAVVFNSQMSRDAAAESYGLVPHSLHVAYGGVDLERMRRPDESERNSARLKLGLDADQFVIAWTGRLSPEKNLPLLLRAIAISRTAPRLVIAGDGLMKEMLTTLANELKINSRVWWVGANPDVRPLLWAADLFAFPSVSESFGNSLAEAMACALPCVAIRADGRLVRNASRELLDDGRAGRLVNEPSAEAFARAIDELAGNEPLRMQFASAAERRAKSLFNWRSGGATLAGLISKISGAKGGSKSAPKLFESLGAGRSTAVPTSVVGTTRGSSPYCA
ncbi:MAG: glycosyltransferase family 4 protein [Phycisphaerae bacterium]|nr:glycosyltransferase family 4 protein [Phycisphaerae bacterium]